MTNHFGLTSKKASVEQVTRAIEQARKSPYVTVSGLSVNYDDPINVMVEFADLCDGGWQIVNWADFEIQNIFDMDPDAIEYLVHMINIWIDYEVAGLSDVRDDIGNYDSGFFYKDCNE